MIELRDGQSIELHPFMIEALPLVHVLQDAGHDVVFVGGCVRDHLLGRSLHDVDLATSATPEEVKQLFERTIPTGEQHGTMTVVWDNGKHYEVTTYRTESHYVDHRHPSVVDFVHQLEQDLQRRDFTMNAMAIRVHRDRDVAELIDPYHGYLDIQRRLLRCVGDAHERFEEDALRIVRAIRFAADLQFTFAHGTYRAACKQAPLLSYIAMERIGAELDKMMCGAHPDVAIARLAHMRIHRYLRKPLPDRVALLLESHRGTLASELQAMMTHRLTPLAERWVLLALATDLRAADVKPLFAALCYAHTRAEQLSHTLAFGERLPQPLSRAALYEAVRMHGVDAATTWLTYAPFAEDGRIEVAAAQDALAYVLEMVAPTLAELEVSGNDLMAHHGRRGGPWLKVELERLWLHVNLRDVGNEREALLAYSNSQGDKQ